VWWGVMLEGFGRQVGSVGKMPGVALRERAKGPAGCGSLLDCPNRVQGLIWQSN
jgi:hypothetical protein